MNKLRKLGFLVLALVCALFVFASCKPKQEGPTAEEAAARISTTQDKQTIVSNFVVNNQVVLEGVTFTVTWESDNAVATVGTEKVDKDGKVAENGAFYLVTINYENNNADQTVKLTATVANGEDKATKTITFTVPKFKTTSFEEYAAAAKGDNLTVEGIVTGMNSKSRGDQDNSLYFNSLDNKGGFYAYSLASDPVTDGIKEGMTVKVSGKKDLYSGTYEIVDPTVTVIDQTIKTVTPVDLTEAYKAAEDLKAAELVGPQALLVTIKGVTITTSEESNGYYKFKLAGKESYIRVSSSNCPLDVEDTKTFKDEFAKHAGWIANATGLVSIYNGAFYLQPVSVDAFEYISLPELSDAEQVAAEKESLKLANTKFGANAELDLPLTGSAYKGVTVSWASNDEAVVVNTTTGKATVTLGSTAKQVKLTATLTKGEATATKEFTLELSADSGIVIVEPENNKEFYAGIYQENLGKYLFFTGVPKDGQTFYQTTTKDLAEATKVKVTAVEGGYKLSFVEGTTTKYITMSINDAGKTSLDIVTDVAKAAVFTYNTEYKTFIQTIGEEQLFIGTYNTYDTLSATWISKIETNFALHLYEIDEDYEAPEVTYVEKTAAEVNESATGTAVKVTGTVIAVNSRGVLLKDSTGIVNVYLSNFATAMGVELVVGDTATVEGVVAVYSNAKQIAPETVTKGTATSYTQPVATDITATADDFVAAQKDTPVTQYVKLTAKYTVSGNYHNLVIEGATEAQGSLVYPHQDFSALVDKDVVVEGWFVYISGGKYINVVVISMTEVAAHQHTPATTMTKDETHHWYVCTECEEVIEKIVHTWTEGQVQTPATEDEDGLRIDNCTCGATKEVTIPKLTHVHSYADTWSTDADNHWYVCSCGDKKDLEAHAGGTATCKDKAVCTKCELAYGKLLETHNYSNGICSICEAADPNYYPEMSIEEALAAADGTKVCVSGTVSTINTAWSDSYNNITVTIKDADGNSLYIYRLATKVELGDVITVKGSMGSHEGSKQIAQGATAEITGHDTSYDYEEMTILEAIEAADNTNVIVTGTVVKIGTAYSEQYNNISVYIADEEGNQLYLYRLTGDVTLKQIIKVKGSMATYNGRQLTGGLFELVGTHECSEYTEATCKTPATCIVCSTAKDNVLSNEHNYVDGLCTVCNGVDPDYEGEVIQPTIVVLSGHTLAANAAKYGDCTEYFKVTSPESTNLSTYVTIDVTKPSSIGLGFYADYRLYKTCIMTITSVQGYKISSITFKNAYSDKAEGTTITITGVSEEKSLSSTKEDLSISFENGTTEIVVENTHASNQFRFEALEIVFVPVE